MRITFFTVLILLTSFAAAAQNQSVEEISVQAFPLSNQISNSLQTSSSPSIDSAEILKRIPGANNNGNGPITGIAQYRGMYGDRISVKLDQAPTLTGGPNAMDSPLSYAPSGLLKELKVYRGIAPVSLAQESIGGHMVATLNRGGYTSEEAFTTSGFTTLQLNDNGDQSNADVQLVTANKQQKFSLLASHNQGNNFSAGDNKTVAGTQYQRDRFDIAYSSKTTNQEFIVFAGQQDVANSGTPALAMDILNVNTDMAGLSFSTNLETSDNPGRINMALSWADVDHGMDNFSLREKTCMAISEDMPMPETMPMSDMMPMNNAMPMANTTCYRKNYAQAENLAWSIDAQLPLSLGELKIGTDGNLQRHHSIISNPKNNAFEVRNFINSERDSLGIFAELSGDSGSWGYQLGLRHNLIKLESDQVGTEGMTPMMASPANMLAMAFNDADRSLSYNTNDMVVKLNRSIDAKTSVTIDLGVKQRAPSYRETYLWLPLSITGGLADGRNYVGNLSLKPETSREITVGISKNSKKFSIHPQVFYRLVDNYIQGITSTNAAANILSNMMGGAPALIYSNTDAKIYGIDANWNFNINDQWSADGLISYVRGKRRDTVDNLYRIAPANARISLRYSASQSPLQLSVESIIYAQQKHIASYASGTETPGYGIINIGANWSINEQVKIRSGITNLFDRYYANHLSSTNRTTDSTIAVGDVIPGMGRAFYLAMQLSF